MRSHHRTAAWQVSAAMMQVHRAAMHDQQPSHDLIECNAPPLHQFAGYGSYMQQLAKCFKVWLSPQDAQPLRKQLPEIRDLLPLYILCIQVG